MAITNGSQALRFDINAAVVFRLGEELITDAVQALVELVKNSYDADATWVKVTIDTGGRNISGRNYAHATGFILVEDDGQGMDESTIRRGWLTIANSPKREEKAAGRVTPRGRTPVGDKGLGRLGSQRLANNVEITTSPHTEPTTEYYVAYSWQDFRETTNLGEVPVTFYRRPVSDRKSGTKLVLSDLREPETWQGTRPIEHMQREFSGMISPFEETRDFQVRLEVDGKRIELTEIAQRVRETALLKYVFDFDAELFSISGAVRLNYLQPNDKRDRQWLNQLCQKDRGKALYDFLASASEKHVSSFAFSQQPEWFVEFRTQRALDNLDGVRRANGSAINPGAFRGEVDVVFLNRSDLSDEVFDRQSDYRSVVRDLAGIRVYRDGFGIRVGEDWLGLGKQWTRGSSYYGLRPANVIGYVAISARDNAELVETTSREGFQVTAHYENFLGLLHEFVRFSGNFQEYLRRGALQFVREQKDRNAGIEPEDAHSTITQRIGDIATHLSAEKRRVNRQSGSLRSAATRAARTLGRVRGDLGRRNIEDSSVPRALEHLEREIAMVSTAAETAEQMLDEVAVALDRASELTSMQEVLDRRWETFQNEMSAFYESISLGLTAEVLSHEINNIADRLAMKSAALLREVDRGARKASVTTYIEHVRSSVAAMRKQLTHLTPSLRYLRERKERIEVFPWAQELARFYNEKLCKKDIEVVVVKKTGSSELVANMNKGKLTQVFDNLVLNAEYWLGEAMRGDIVKHGEITIVVDAPMVRFEDNGRGVDESVEESLFDPFVTTKGRGQGRGLGLFVVRQLLDSESSGIVLLPARNARDRRYVFEVDLSGAVSV